MVENSAFDKKSLKAILGKNVKWKELAKDCVAFANAHGGEIHIGIEDNETLPPAEQTVDPDLITKLQKWMNELTIQVGVSVSKHTAENGGDYIVLRVFRSVLSMASTTDGKYFIRIGDSSKPVMPEELARLAGEKQAFTWEEKAIKNVSPTELDEKKLQEFLDAIYNSDRVSGFIKEMDKTELLEYYMMISEGYLTNLGVLWLGKRKHRASLHYAPTIQYIKFDENENKIKKLVWDDYFLNPKELLNEIIKISDWSESIEISDGIFRKNIPNYDIEIIRELMANALVHKVYTMRGDIFINLFHDRLEICSPGCLPLGVTPRNIINKSVARNRHLAKLFYDLKLMEKEGSGYDKVYEILLFNGKPVPEVIEEDDSVSVIVRKNVIDKSVVKIMSRANEEFHLKQKEIITLGLIAQAGNISSLDLGLKLSVKRTETLHNWIGKLLKYELILSKGRTKGTEYVVNPELLRQVDFKGRTDLKKIEPHRLQELIIADLTIYNGSAIGDLNDRIGNEINRRKLKRQLERMVEDTILHTEGEKKGTRYFIDQKLSKNK